MEDKYTKDAIHICRLMFGQAVLELLGDDQRVTNGALEEKVKKMLPDCKPELVYDVAMKLLKHSTLNRPGFRRHFFAS
ncbi:hypothetical protein [Pantoea agglomerans]|uniref:hypothetical protein n=1 Tax=Enterobacter agglomerans TaxID=549 RepID=UPI00177BD463|nr:hypothetical protein [Pantoea agglomerans]MBD8133883.1 hypothetical protein [Pantoea agglomerans]